MVLPLLAYCFIDKYYNDQDIIDKRIYIHNFHHLREELQPRNSCGLASGYRSRYKYVDAKDAVTDLYSNEKSIYTKYSLYIIQFIAP